MLFRCSHACIQSNETLNTPAEKIMVSLLRNGFLAVGGGGVFIVWGDGRFVISDNTSSTFIMLPKHLP